MQQHRDIARSLCRDWPRHDPSFSEEQLRVGSLVLRVRSSQPRFLPMLHELIRTRPLGSVRRSDSHTLFLTLVEDPQTLDALAAGYESGLQRADSAGPAGQAVTEIRHDISRSIVCDTDAQRTDVLVLLGSAGQSEERILSAIMIAVYRILYHLGRVLIHAAAIGMSGGTNVLLGDKGSGKTTTSMYLGRRGFPILAEDHVLLCQRPDGYTVSGCDDCIRLTRETELLFFENGLDLPITDIGGVAKKELDPTTREEILWRPFEDAPVRRLFLPRVGDEFKVERLASLPAVLGLVASVQKRFRFVDRDDRQRFLDYFSDFVEPLEVYRLTLSRDLDQLHRLADWFEEHQERG
ncbi:MAG: hypothetical protein VYE73_11325 [Acidobacteriota bacterium]|nr:hypothetical protein [Acidobacteriota bacterium]